MASERLSAASRQFLTDEIHSVMQLELLLLLHRDADLRWSAAAASRELRAPQPWVEDQLRGMVAHGLVEATLEDEDEPLYRFDRRGPLAAAIDEIALCFPRWRTSMIALIYRARPADPQV
jgi:hypothetical protein